jgi:uncharacterized protein (TIGR02246 family)
MSRRSVLRVCVPLIAALALVSPSIAGAQGVESPRIPLRTAMNELNTLRTEYAEAFNAKNAAAVSALYLPDAVVITRDGTKLAGSAAIAESMTAAAANWPQTTFASDTIRVFGNSAWDIGTLTSTGADGKVEVSRYLVILRRGMQYWRIASVAVVPVAKAGM